MILKDKTILVTGGTGSMGKKLVHRLLTGELGTPKKVIVLSRIRYGEACVPVPDAASAAALAAEVMVIGACVVRGSVVFPMAV